jgi:hypothetical protein
MSIIRISMNNKENDQNSNNLNSFKKRSLNKYQLKSIRQFGFVELLINKILN